jgi:hypothetical protein
MTDSRQFEEVVDSKRTKGAVTQAQ